MNLVAVLVAPAVVAMSAAEGANHAARVGIAVVAALIAGGAVLASRLRATRTDRKNNALAAADAQ